MKSVLSTFPNGSRRMWKNEKITAKKIRDTLKNLQKIMDEQIPLYQVFEWKDDMIHILDSLFLFYIRWMPF